MKLIRFMSKKEFDDLMAGKVLVNDKKHQSNTNSVGFCFLPYEDDDFDQDSIENEIGYAFSFLGGIVSEDYVVIFESNDTELKEGYGIYADPFGAFFDTMCITEYSLTQYDKNSLVPLWWAKDCYDVYYNYV